MSVFSGVPKQEGGVWVGATDFSELALSTSGSTAWVFRGVAGNDPRIGIGNDAVEGNYLFADPEGDFDSFALEYLPFNGLTEYAELLARIWIPTEVGNRRIWGPAVSITGADGASTSFNWAGGGMYMRSGGPDFESNSVNTLKNSAGLVTQNDLQEAEQTQVWAWMRFKLRLSTGGADDWFVKTWYGSSTDEPGSWDGFSLDAFTSPRLTAGIGMAVPALVRNAEHRCAFLSFSEDPDVAAAPLPSDVVAGAPAVAEYLAKLDWRS